MGQHVQAVQGGAGQGDRMRNNLGQFERTVKPFSLDNFNDGYIDAKGRMRVYYPKHPRASSEGYILREIIAYEMYWNVAVPIYMEIHHKDGSKSNDIKENLTMLTKSRHRQIHAKMLGQRIERLCQKCGNIFEMAKYRLKEKGHAGKFCSLKCYFASGGKWYNRRV